MKPKKKKNPQDATLRNIQEEILLESGRRKVSEEVNKFDKWTLAENWAAKNKTRPYNMKKPCFVAGFDQAITLFLAECEKRKRSSSIMEASGHEFVLYWELIEIAKKMRGEGKGGD